MFLTPLRVFKYASTRVVNGGDKKILSSEAKILNVTKACDMFDTMFDASLLSPKCFMNPFLCQVMHNKNVLFLENWLGET